MLQIRMKVVEHESSFITFIEFQFIIDDVKALQKQQNYLKMYIQCKILSVKNIILLKNLK
jgi:Na+/citrate or Na+/malate symporter